MKVVRRLCALMLGPAAVVMMSGAAVASPASEAVDLPDGMTASYAVFDRETGASWGHDVHKQYRSASVVKLFIALDYLESHGPEYVIPPEDLALLEPMLRSSDDDAASVLWVRDGWEQIVVRMAAEIGLPDTAPPAERGKWGYTAISAADVVRTYQYILTEAHPNYRDFIMGNLYQATRCAADTFDQSFGIPSALPGAWAYKQGWSGFGAAPAPGEECVEQSQVVPDTQEVRDAIAAVNRDHARSKTAPDIDLTSRAMHTTGTDDEKIVVVLTLEPTTLSWQDSADRITDLAEAVYDGDSDGL
ncbi:hypothetical protein [Actinophytocola oryzae]|uniref:Beta-lactamase family protein n=1 Tax=Actinophytocola oryzae TaxID=502181 RepID=A0A4R7UQW9_9PSEU|nr:hypothetical protein [Actinophytocola oryzae]TDV35381.1 hypothetical protein CLV71_1356 [Actinophytocola oryzae]